MKYTLLFFISITICNACTTKNESANVDAMTLPAPKVVKKELDVSEKIDEDKNLDVNANTSIPFERKLSKTGNLSFETDNLKETNSSIIQIVTLLQGIIANDKLTIYDTREEHIMEVKVPSAKFDSLIILISQNVSKFDTKDIRILDVTEEFIDLNARIKTKKEIELRYIALLDKARTVEDILSIEKELASIQEEIESMQGKLNYLTNQVAESTLSIMFYNKSNQNFGYWLRLKNALIWGWSGLLSFTIGLANMWAFFLLGLIAFILIRKHFKKMKFNKIQNKI